MSGKTVLIFSFLLIFTINQSVGAQDYTSFLSKSSFTGNDRLETIVTIPERGWYSISASSSTGTAISLVDRMSGILASNGSPAVIDGRIDYLLDEGEYKIRIVPDNSKALSVKLKLNKYKELHGNLKELPTLFDGDFIKTTLEDLQTRSYWLYFSEKQILRLEALGRNLQECQIWKDGIWREKIQPAKSVYSPVKEEPMGYFEFNHMFQAGFYQIQFVGGKAMDWSNQKSSNPLYIRRGIEYIGDSGYRPLAVSVFGRDTYEVSSKTNYFQARGEPKKAIALQISQVTSESSRYYNILNSMSMGEKDLEPLCSFYVSSSYRKYVTLQGEPGLNTELLVFPAKNEESFASFNKYDMVFISCFTSLSEYANLDTAGILYNYNLKSNVDGYLELIRSPSLGPAKPYARSLNLFSYAQTILYIEKSGTYKVLEQEAEAKYNFSLINSTVKAVTITAKQSQYLAKGYYYLSVEPVKAGFIKFALYSSEDQKKAQEMLAAQAGGLARGFVIPLYTVYDTNHSLKVSPTGAILSRILPLDLSNPLTLILEPGQTVKFTVKVVKKSNFMVWGSNCSISINDTDVSLPRIVSPDTYVMAIANKGLVPGYFSLEMREIPVPPNIVKPDLVPVEKLYPVIKESSPLFYDYKRNESKYFLLQVEKPSFYKVETSGRLNIQLKIRTVLDPDFAVNSSAVIWGNTVISRYLKPGKYLIETSAQGLSMGRAGVHLTPVVVIDGGILSENTILRHTVEKDTAIRFKVHVDNENSYKIESFGQQASFSYRFEDSDGWPLAAAGSGLFSANLKPGDYNWLLMPTVFKTKRITRMSLSAQKPPAENELVLGITKEGLWKEKADRIPDSYLLTLPAKIDVSCEITASMLCEIYDAKGGLVKKISDASVFTLDQGVYTVKVKSKETNNNVSYKLVFRTEQLAVGLTKIVNKFPASVTLVNNKSQIVNIWSIGLTDVKAVLTDIEGKVLIDSSDDRDNDWNFLMSRALPEGRYKLTLENLKSSSSAGSVTLYMDSVVEKTITSVFPGFAYNGTIGNEVLRFNFKTGAKQSLCFFKQDGLDPLFLSLYKKDQRIAASRNQIYIPLDANTEYTLHVRHQESGLLTVNLKTGVIETSPVSLDDREVSFPIKQALLLKNNRRLSFRITGSFDGILYSGALEKICEPALSIPQNTLNDSGWIFNPEGQGSVTLSPVILSVDKGELFYSDEFPHSFLFSQGPGTLVLFKAESPGEQTAFIVQKAAGYSKDFYSWESMAMTGSGTYAAVSENGDYQCRVWLATGGKEKRPLFVSSVLYKVAKQDSILLNENRIIPVPPNSGLILNLEKKGQDIELLLSKGVTAFCWEDGKPVDIAFADTENLSVVMQVSGGTLALVNTSNSEALTRVSITPALSGKITMAEVSGVKSFDTVKDKPGELRLIAGEPRGKTLLCAAGDDITVELLSDDGRIINSIKTQQPFPMYTFPYHKGMVKIKYSGGFIRVWASSDSASALKEFIAADNTKKSRNLEPDVVLENQEQLWDIKLDKPAYIRLFTKAPGITALLSGDRILSVSATGLSTGRDIYYYLAPGAYKAVTKPFAGAIQAMPLLLRSSIPREITADSAERFFIGAGEKQIFTFKVNTAGKIGVGIKAESESLNGYLYDSNFNLIAEGSLVFRDLEPGSYFYIAWATAGAVQYQPVIVGVDGSITGIPRDVVNKYKEGR